MHVFILWHCYEKDTGEDESKLIGVYSSQVLAEGALKRTRRLPGFRDRPKSFGIDKYKIDEDHWTTGYVTDWPPDTAQ